MNNFNINLLSFFQKYVGKKNTVNKFSLKNIWSLPCDVHKFPLLTDCGVLKRRRDLQVSEGGYQGDGVV